MPDKIQIRFRHSEASKEFSTCNKLICWFVFLGPKLRFLVLKKAKNYSINKQLTASNISNLYSEKVCLKKKKKITQIRFFLVFVFNRSYSYQG